MMNLSSEKYFQQFSSLLLKGGIKAIKDFITQHTIVDRFVEPSFRKKGNSFDDNLPVPPKDLNIII